MSARDHRAPAGLEGALEYLGEIGFGELYAARVSSASASSAESAPGSQPDLAAAPPDAGIDAPIAADERRTALETVAVEASVCERCALASGRKTVVFGVGNADADLMFIGEGPGAEEDRQGVPFVGPAGVLLTRIIQAIELERDDVYIANIVKCRPPRNRDPMPEEVAACREYLERQIDLVQPRILVALGRVAAQTLLGSGSPLGKMRGVWYEVRGVPTRVTYHPAALLRNAGFKRPTWEDMQVVRDRLGELAAGC